MSSRLFLAKHALSSITSSHNIMRVQIQKKKKLKDLPEGKTTELLTLEYGGGAGVDAGFAVFTVLAKPSPAPVRRCGLPYVAAYRTSTPWMIPPFGTRFTGEEDECLGFCLWSFWGLTLLGWLPCHTCLCLIL